jgi:hypothetical protein
VLFESLPVVLGVVLDVAGLVLLEGLSEQRHQSEGGQDSGCVDSNRSSDLRRQAGLGGQVFESFRVVFHFRFLS